MANFNSKIINLAIFSPQWYSSNRHPLQALYDWTCMVTVTMQGVSKCAMHSVSKCQVIRSQPSHSVVVKVSITELSNAAAIGLGARSMLADFGMYADVKRIGGRLTTRTWSPPTRADSLSVCAATSARGRPSLEEGAGRHERQRRAEETSGREAHDEPVDNDGLQVQRWANFVSAESAVTN